MGNERSNLLISYSDRDRKWADELRGHIRQVLGDSVPVIELRSKSDAPLKASGEYRQYVDEMLGDAFAVIPLISADYVRSRPMLEVELPRFSAADSEGVLILPISVGAWAIEQIPTLMDFEFANDPHRPLETLTKRESEEVLSRVAHQIQVAVRRTQLRKRPSDSPENATSVSRSSKRATIFLCYRRDDTQGEAGRLHDRLAAAYGAERVFMDIDSVPLGIDFVEHVTEQISGCSAVIVMIGRQWLKAKDKKRRRRLDDPDDLVRAEIAAALKQKVPVIPVLVQDASMPTGADLPEDIRLLARRNGIALRHDQWREGVERLLKELNPVMGRSQST